MSFSNYKISVMGSMKRLNTKALNLLDLEISYFADPTAGSGS